MKLNQKKIGVTDDLKKVIPNFNQFAAFISEFKDIVDTGKLAELYCSKLFGLELVNPHNASIDAMSSSGERIEIKHRFYAGKIPPGMKINLQNIDYIFYVELDRNLLPKRILRIRSKDLHYTTGNRVSFKKVLNENKVDIIFQN